MRFMHLWPLFLLITIPVIIIMYLLKQKAVSHPVPSLFLWNEMYRNKESDTPWEKLKKNRLLIIQIITVLILVFTLMSPYTASETKPSENVVLLIDNSGSMNTILSNKKTRLDYARNAAKEYVKTLPDNTAVTVIACSERTTSLLSGSLDRSAVLNAIDGIEGTTLAGDCSGGLSVCQGLAAGDASLTVNAFTDSPISLGGLTGTIYNFSAPAENLSLDYISSAVKNEKLTILACLTNHGNNEASGDLNLYGDGELINVTSYDIPAGESRVIYFENTVFNGTVLKAEINTPDALLTDNTAYCVNSAKKSGRVLLLTSRNIYLKKAIELNENIILHETNDPETFSGKAAEGYDLYIIDGQDMLPETLPAEGNLMFIRCDPGQYFEIAENLENVYLTLESGKYTSGIEDHSFGAASVMTVEQPVWARSFISAGSRTAGFIGDTAGRKICFLGFDMHDTDLPLDYRFPILIWNLVTELGNSDLLAASDIFCGTPMRINASSEGLTPTLIYPDGHKESLKELPYIFRNTDEPGVYILDKGDEKTEAFSVNFDTTESRTVQASPASQTTSADTVVVDATQSTSRSYRPLLIVLLLLVLGAEWIVYIRD